MNWINSISTRWKLFFSFSGLILFSFLLIYFNLDAYDSIEDITTGKVSSSFKTVSHLNLLQKSVSLVNDEVTLFATELRTLESKIYDPMKKNVKQELDSLRAMLSGIEDNTTLLEVIRATESYLASSDSVAALLGAITPGQVPEAEKLQSHLKRRNESYSGFNLIVTNLISAYQLRSVQSFDNVDSIIDNKRVLLIITGGFLILLAIVLIAFLNTNLALPLLDLSRAAETVSTGDLTVTVKHTDRRDEIGVLAHSFAGMVTSLKVITSELNDAVNNLNKFSNKIFQNTAELASSSTETVAAITETTATVEEVRQTSYLSNKKAKEVAERSQQSFDISAAGQESTRSTIEGIQRFGTHMNSISDNILKLSERSRLIGEIIAAVNDIAEQSNLLAVNASIEAARAGEQGKGFAVVAQEIRNLAEQSKQSTSQVRLILQDIQNFVNSAVLSTEQASKALEDGIKTANQAGEVITELAKSIELAFDASLQITSSNQQQQIGMDQIATAMENIRTVSAHNADSTKEVEISTNELLGLGDNLSGQIKKFKIDGRNG
ncbi:MAG: hypothetical protein HBSAPP04_25950 [Ignavibacteriaceae bacterium]|nr:MAG: hypothetical protein HBSAPP04_25950 [Ignavibacteriaceae bacterium]